MKTVTHKSLLYVGAMFLILSLGSCSKNLTYFTERLADENQWTESELKQIQFYVSQDIVLYRSQSAGGTEIRDGKIIKKGKRKADEIVIHAGTPGILLFMPKDDRYAVSFDDSGYYLIFGPGDKTNGRFTLRAKKWKSNRNGGIITYGEEEYLTGSQSAYAALMVDMKRATSSKVTRGRASGRKVR